MTLVSVQFEDGIATITLNRPDRFNALSVALARELADAAMAVSESIAELVVLTGAGRAFCAGGDAQEMAASVDRSAYLDELVSEANNAMTVLRELPQPMVARLNGAVAGAGLGLLLTSDLAVAREDVKFTPAYGSLGLSPDCGVTILLENAIGSRRARDLLLTGRQIDAETALDWGLVARVAPAEDLDAALAEVVEGVRRSGPLAPAATKELMGAQGTYAQRLDMERESISRLASTEFAGDRLDAFAAR